MDNALAAANLYDARTRTIVSDRDMLMRLVGNSTVAEVGVGTGRILRWLIEAGSPRIVGIDFDGAKLEVARLKFKAHGAKISLVQSEFLKFSTTEKFGRVLFGFNVLAEFFAVSSKIAAIRHASNMLAEGGQLVVVNMMHDFESFSNTDVRYSYTLTDAEAEQWDVAMVCSRLQVAQISTCDVSYVQRGSGLRIFDSFKTSLVTRNELLAVFAAAGTEIVEEYGSYKFEPVNETSKVLIHVLKPERK